jgi:hypothetical protein
MPINGRVLFSLGLAALAVFAIVSASSWPLKARLFPLVTAIPLLVLALVQLFLDLRGKTGATEVPASDIALSTDVPPAIAHRRTLLTFAWMAAFVALVFLVGFPLAVPLFMFSYLMFQSADGFWRSLAMTAAAWGFFYGLFERLLRLPFGAGIVQSWLGL